MDANFRQGLRDYLRLLPAYPLLTVEEELALGQKMRMVDALLRSDMNELPPIEHSRTLVEAAAARERMIHCNLRLVISVAKRYGHRALPVEDVIDEGNLGLMRAVDRFDPLQGVRFSTFARPWIEHAIRRALRTGLRLIRIPSHLHRGARQMRLAQQQLDGQLGHAASILELAQFMSISPRQARNIAQALLVQATRNQGELRDDGGAAIFDSLPDPKTPEPVVAQVVASDLALIAQVMQRIPDEELRILTLHYGLGEIPARQMTLTEIAAEMSMTRDHVRQIERRTIAKLRRAIMRGCG